VCLGEGSYAETPGNITDLTLGEPQLRLAEAIEATGKPVVLVLVEGRPRVISRIADAAQAILLAYNPGNEGGVAVADVLFGDYDPAGKLPISVPRSVGQLPIFYNHKPSARRGYLFANKEPLFPFGFGLSYTTFAYTNLQLAQEQVAPDDTLVATVEVTNTGSVSGEEVVQLSITAHGSTVERAPKDLKAFAPWGLCPARRARCAWRCQSPTWPTTMRRAAGSSNRSCTRSSSGGMYSTATRCGHASACSEQRLNGAPLPAADGGGEPLRTCGPCVPRPSNC
jgi:beta-glucosidase